MRRIVVLLSLIAVFLLSMGTAANAFINPTTHWSDGTTYQGPANYGPPPKPIKSLGDDCNVWGIDPPTYVYVTVHVFEGGVEYDSAVYPYEHQAPGYFNANVHALVNGHDGEGYLTWNIGTGHSPTFQFHCSTPTTSSTVSSTTSSTTSTTISSTSTSFISSSSTSSTSLPTTVPNKPTTPLSASPIGTELPMTGNYSWGVIGLGAVLLSLGLILVWRTWEKRK